MRNWDCMNTAWPGRHPQNAVMIILRCYSSAFFDKRFWHLSAFVCGQRRGRHYWPPPRRELAFSRRLATLPLWNLWNKPCSINSWNWKQPPKLWPPPTPNPTLCDCSKKLRTWPAVSQNLPIRRSSTISSARVTKRLACSCKAKTQNQKRPRQANAFVSWTISAFPQTRTKRV